MSNAKKARISKNVLPSITTGSRLDGTNGSEISAGSYKISPFIPINSEELSISCVTSISTVWQGVYCLYDDNHAYISGHTDFPSSLWSATVNTNGAAYIRISTVNDAENIMINEGSTPLPYEPYGEMFFDVPCAVKRYTAGEEQNNSTGIFAYKGLTLEKNRTLIKATGASTDIISSTDQFFKDNFSVLLEAGKTYTILGRNTVVDDSYIDVRYRDSDDIITTTGYLELPNAVTIAPNTDTYIYIGIGLSAGVQCSKGNFTAHFYRQAGWHDTPVYVRQNSVWVVQT